MANVVSQYWSEGAPTQMELFEDTDRDFETMKRKIKGQTNRTARILDEKGWLGGVHLRCGRFAGMGGPVLVSKGGWMGVSCSRSAQGRRSQRGFRACWARRRGGVADKPHPWRLCRAAS